jgi:hypothetical protein
LTPRSNGNRLAVLPIGKLQMGVHHLSGSRCFAGATGALNIGIGPPGGHSKLGNYCQ